MAKQRRKSVAKTPEKSTVTVRCLSTGSGPSGVFHPGDILELEPHDAEQRISLGYAVAVDGSETPEPVADDAGSGSKDDATGG